MISSLLRFDNLLLEIYVKIDGKGVSKTPSVFNLITGSPLIRFDNLFQNNDGKLRDLPDTNPKYIQKSIPHLSGFTRGPGLFQRFNVRTKTKLNLILIF